MLHNNPLLEEPLAAGAAFDIKKLYPEGRRASVASKLLMLLVAPILMTFYMVFVLIFLVIYSIGVITCIFPWLEKSRTDAELKAQNRKKICEKNPDFFEISVPGDINFASQGEAYTICARTGLPKAWNGKPPIIFVNGLMAPLFLMMEIQDALTEVSITFFR